MNDDLVDDDDEFWEARQAAPIKEGGNGMTAGLA